jgi:hypothetical protein
VRTKVTSQLDFLNRNLPVLVDDCHRCSAGGKHQSTRGQIQSRPIRFRHNMDLGVGTWEDLSTLAVHIELDSETTGHRVHCPAVRVIVAGKWWSGDCGSANQALVPGATAALTDCGT